MRVHVSLVRFGCILSCELAHICRIYFTFCASFFQWTCVSVYSSSTANKIYRHGDITAAWRQHINTNPENILPKRRQYIRASNTFFLKWNFMFTELCQTSHVSFFYFDSQTERNSRRQKIAVFPLRTKKPTILKLVKFLIVDYLWKCILHLPRNICLMRLANDKNVRTKSL